MNSSYEYIDSGNRKRLERFGDKLVIRSCPSAIWERKLSLSEWNESNNSTIVYEGTSGHAGKWKMNDDTINSNWYVKFHEDQLFLLEPSDMGQIGIFPEQQRNWQMISKLLQKYKVSNINSNSNMTYILNGFAYTGGSTTAALSVESVEVVHLDAAKSAIEWAKKNVAISNIHPTSKVRWIVDDCMTFLEREIKRNKKYDALIFDPPAFGRGKGGSIWKLDKDMNTLVEKFPKLLSDNPCFVLLSCHDLYWTPMRLADILQSTLRSSGYKKGRVDCGEMILKSTRGGNSLPLGAFALWSNI
jgi:23S rRNA (cytosine1962-C5)-methyltransferase